MEFKASQIAEMVGGHVEGNPDARITDFAKIEEGKAGAQTQSTPISSMTRNPPSCS